MTFTAIPGDVFSWFPLKALIPLEYVSREIKKKVEPHIIAKLLKDSLDFSQLLTCYHDRVLTTFGSDIRNITIQRWQQPIVWMKFVTQSPKLSHLYLYNLNHINRVVFTHNKQLTSIRMLLTTITDTLDLKALPLTSVEFNQVKFNGNSQHQIHFPPTLQEVILVASPIFKYKEDLYPILESKNLQTFIIKELKFPDLKEFIEDYRKKKNLPSIKNLQIT